MGDLLAHIPHATSHPLEPLTMEEITEVASIVRAYGGLRPRARFISITLREPLKEAVLAYTTGETPPDRQADVVLVNSPDLGAVEVVVSLTEARVISWRHISGVQPAITFEEVLEVEHLVKSSPMFREVLANRGITDMDLVMVEPWPAGYYGPEDDPLQHRLSRPIVFVRNDPQDNGHAHPIEGVVVLVDLNEMTVLRVEDYGEVPIPRTPGNYTPKAIPHVRNDVKPLEIKQPDGPSFEVKGHEVHWQKWKLRVGFTAREGLVLHTVSYQDGERERPILYRASIAEMIVPYGDPNPTHFRKNVLDEGEHGLGLLTNSLTLGCDCLGEIHYFDAVVANNRGEPMVLSNAICMHEEDYGILWKHTDWRTNKVEVRRSRRLVISFFATVGHYDYGFFWYFYQDGSIQFEVKLTGIMNSGAIPEGVIPKHGTLVAPGVYAIIHQHFFSLRLDMMVDGVENSVSEVETLSDPIGPENPHGNAFYAATRPLRTELEAQRIIDPLKGRYWLVTNSSKCNLVNGLPVGYKLVPSENVLPFAHPEAWVSKRASFINRHLWVTPYHPNERYPAGEYPNQHPGGDGLTAWTQANRSIEGTDVVLWYTLGVHHVPRIEEWPVMPVSYAGFALKPSNFFVENPALDVPVPPSHHEESCHQE